MRSTSQTSTLLLCCALSLASGCDLFRAPLDPPTMFAQRAVLESQQDLVTLKVGEQKPVSVSVVDADGVAVSDPDIRWSVEDEAIGRIVGEGAQVNVEGLAVGQTRIQAQYLDQQVDVVLQVQQAANVATIDASPSSLGLVIGESVRVMAIVKDEAGEVIEQPELEVTVDRQAIATVDDTLLVTGVKEGSATLSITSDGVTKTVPITVTAPLSVEPSVSVGPEHACSINTDGRATCWGSGRDGRLGSAVDPSLDPGFLPLATTIGLTSLSAGETSTCGLTSLGDVYCWGSDPRKLASREFDKDSGVTKIASTEPMSALASGASMHCGIGQTSSKAHCIGRLGPLEYNALSPVFDSFTWTDLSVGDAHVCGVSSNKVYCWGANDQGQSGQASRSGIVDTPKVVRKSDGTELGAKRVFARGDVSCAIQLNDQTVCWGSSASGHFAQSPGGFAVAGSSHVPVDVARGYAFESLAVSTHHVCGLTDEAAVWCWGDNLYGQFGRRPLNRSDDPLKMGGTLKFTSISAYGSFMCGITTTDKVACWGDQGLNFLGDGELGYTPLPVSIDMSKVVDPIVSVGLGARHSCLATAGMMTTRVGCWGRGSEGQLSVLDQNTDPVDQTVDIERMVPGGLIASPGAVLKAGAAHTCIFTPEDSSTYCAGDNQFRQSANTTSPQINIFSALAWDATPLGMALGPYATCTHTSDEIDCYGPQGTEPTLTIASDIRSLSLGTRHGCFIDGPDGNLYCWGDNSDGQLGQGDREPRVDPVLVLSDAVAVSAADDYTCALVLGGKVRCWGRDEFSRLGQSSSSFTTLTSPTPVEIPGVMTAIATGDQHACALDSSNQVHCWGHGLYGLTGVDSNAPLQAPTVVSAVTGSTGLAVSGGHSCAWTDTSVKCWGRATQGRTGDKLGFKVNPVVFDP